jgi:hypothetical protein
MLRREECPRAARIKRLARLPLQSRDRRASARQRLRDEQLSPEVGEHWQILVVAVRPSARRGTLAAVIVAVADTIIASICAVIYWPARLCATGKPAPLIHNACTHGTPSSGGRAYAPHRAAPAAIRAERGAAGRRHGLGLGTCAHGGMVTHAGTVSHATRYPVQRHPVRSHGLHATRYPMRHDIPCDTVSE